MRAERVLDGNRIRTAATGRQKLHGKIIYSIIVNFCFPHTNYNINKKYKERFVQHSHSHFFFQ